MLLIVVPLESDTGYHFWPIYPLLPLNTLFLVSPSEWSPACFPSGTFALRLLERKKCVWYDWKMLSWCHDQVMIKMHLCCPLLLHHCNRTSGFVYIEHTKSDVMRSPKTATKGNLFLTSSFWIIKCCTLFKIYRKCFRSILLQVFE